MAPQSPALRDTQPRITLFCEPVPETYFISSLAPITTELGTAGYVIEASGRYVLTHDLVVPDVDFGILVRAPNVILDLGGHALSDEDNDAILVRMSGNVDLSIRNGALKKGAMGIAGNDPGPWGSPQGWLSLSRLEIEGDAIGYAPIDVGFVGRVEIVDSVIRGGRLIIRWGTFGSRIVESKIASSINIEEFDGGRLLGNTIDGSVQVGGDGAVIRGNVIRGAASGMAALKVLWGTHFIRDNEIIANGLAHALAVEGYGITSGNVLSGGEESTVAALIRGGRIRGNIINSPHIGIAVSGDSGLVESNRIGGENLQCGVMFTSGRHVYRNNAVYRAEEAFCGEPGIDGGGNETSPGCPAEICDGQARRSLARGIRWVVLREERIGMTDLSRGRTRTCEPGEVIPISGPRPAETPNGKTALLIDAPGYYLVSRDLHLPESTSGYVDAGVLITSPNVTLDFGGHTIDPEDAFVALKVIGAENVVLRNGALHGGFHGLSLRGDAASGVTRVRLERMWIGRGDTSGYSALSTANIKNIEILDSYISGVDSAARIFGQTTGRIIGNQFRASKVGMDLGEFRDGVVRDNYFRGVHIGSRNLVKRNLSDSGIVLFGGGNTVEENSFEDSLNDALNADQVSSMEGNHVRENLLDGPISLGSIEDVFQGNTVVYDNIEVSGTAARLNDNIFVNAGPCAVEFEREAGHRYRDNVAINASEGFCGATNIDEGGNVFPAATCGNGIKSVTEMCDGRETLQSCKSLGFDDGDVFCNATCDGFTTAQCSLCGDGIITVPEKCDGDSLGGRTCISEGLEGGTLSCAADCRSIDKSGCTGCGNGIIEGAEVCDGPDLGGATCSLLGLEGESLRCNAQCSGFDLTSCSGCGNGVVEGTEWCDGTSHWSTPTCEAYGFSGGPVACRADCTVDTTACWRCGNGVREGGEACDGADLGGQTCGSLGKPFGTLSCTSICTFNTNGCEGF